MEPELEYEFQEEFVLRKTEGIGGKDVSDELDDMTYVEKMVTSEPFLRALARLSVAKEVITETDRKVYGGTILLKKSDISKFRDDGSEVEMSTAANQINKVFVAYEVPFFAKPWATDDAPEVKKTGKRGKKKDIEYTTTPANRLRIFRISEEFNVDNYFAEKSVKVLTGKVKASHEPSGSMRGRAGKWIDQIIEENNEAMFELLRKVGITFDSNDTATDAVAEEASS